MLVHILDVDANRLSWPRFKNIDKAQILSSKTHYYVFLKILNKEGFFSV